MASLTHGMNLDDVEALGRYLQQEASRRVLSMVDELDRAVAASSWRGPDADRFRRDWWPKHKANLRQVGEHLHGFGQSALNNATEQERASDEARSTRAMSGGADAAAGSLGATDE